MGRLYFRIYVFILSMGLFFSLAQATLAAETNIRRCSALVRALKPWVGERGIYEVKVDLTQELNQVQPIRLLPFHFSANKAAFRHSKLSRGFDEFRRSTLIYTKQTKPWNVDQKPLLDILKTTSKFNFILHTGGIAFVPLLDRPNVLINDFITKHLMLAHENLDVRYGGELWLEEENGSFILQLNGESGTFRPDRDLAPKIRTLVEKIFSEIALKL